MRRPCSGKHREHITHPIKELAYDPAIIECDAIVGDQAGYLPKRVHGIGRVALSACGHEGDL